MQQNNQVFNAFWKTLFSFTITKLASFVVCWKWWRKGEKKSASLKFNGSEENEFLTPRSASSPIRRWISRLEDNFNGKFRDWVLGLWWFMSTDWIRPFQLSPSQANLNAPFHKTWKASIKSTVQNPSYIINWQVIWFVFIVKIFSNFPTQRWKNSKDRISEHNSAELCCSCSRKCFLRKWKQVSSDRKGISTLGKKVISSSRLTMNKNYLIPTVRQADHLNTYSKSGNNCLIIDIGTWLRQALLNVLGMI